MQSVMNSHNDDTVGWKIKIAKMGSDKMLWQAGAVYRKTLCCNFLCVKAQTECFFISFSHRPLPKIFSSALVLSHLQYEQTSLALRNFLICVINWIFRFSTDVLAIHLNSPIFQAFILFLILFIVIKFLAQGFIIVIAWQFSFFLFNSKEKLALLDEKDWKNEQQKKKKIWRASYVLYINFILSQKLTLCNNMSAHNIQWNDRMVI